MKAKQRWQLLADVIKKRKVPTNNSSVRCINKLGIINIEQSDSDENIFKYTMPPPYSSTVLFFQHMPLTLNLDELLGFNNTGNVCVWPSEEALALDCLHYKSNAIWTGKRVMELGGGMTCLAGVTVAASTQAKTVHLTDGNERCVANLNEIVKLNVESFGETQVNCEILNWENEVHCLEYRASIDVLLCSDCLFWKSGRSALLQFISEVLKEDGVALVTAPERSGSMSDFVHQIGNSGTLQAFAIPHSPIVIEALDKLKNNTLFDPDLHKPLLLEIRKIGSN